jgi:hypothetical protein
MNSKSYSSTKKLSKSGKRTASSEGGAVNKNLQDNFTPNSAMKVSKESGRSPGKIFNFDKNGNLKDNVKVKEEGYSTLLKNV